MILRRLTANQFKSMVRKNQRLAPEMAVFKEGFLSADAPDPENAARTLQFTCSTSTVDRENDVINQSGWKLDNYIKNPLVLWMHEHDKVIGKALSIGVVDGALKSVFEFKSADYPVTGVFAEDAYRSYKAGFMTAVSVGFKPLEWDITDDKERGADDWFAGIDFHSSELLEISVVGVPCNPDALLDPVISMAGEVPNPKDVEAAALAQAALEAVREARRQRQLQARRITFT
jgi:HK97 family phage prohead protease